MYITGHTATDEFLQSDNLKGVWRRRGVKESEGDLKLDWGLRTSIAASSFERGGNGLDWWKDDEKLEWKLGRMFLGITSNSQFPDHIYMVSVSEPLRQTISQFHLSLSLSVPVSQLSHNALSLTTAPPPVPGSARITRPRVLINSDTPAIPRSRKGKRNFWTGAHSPWQKAPVFISGEEECSISGQSQAVCHPDQLWKHSIGTFCPWFPPFGRCIGFEIGGLDAGEKIQNLFPWSKTKKRVIGFLSNPTRCHLHEVDVAAP